TINHHNPPFWRAPPGIPSTRPDGRLPAPPDISKAGSRGAFQADNLCVEFLFWPTLAAQFIPDSLDPRRLLQFQYPLEQVRNTLLRDNNFVGPDQGPGKMGEIFQSGYPAFGVARLRVDRRPHRQFALRPHHDL